ncbi:MAG: SynChlorMet cassette radical SAM/SPASM protein ScmF [Candidatus Electronema sp. V4]|uniref:SynChlorMet cassette radical SAM/SPASM protein ScmF n=1 Tax=Candidatus Electronema sp. V4 TaxID=3454756 RepID=UPI004055744B
MSIDHKMLSDYPLRQIYFYLTEGCNLQCRHCWIAPTYQAKAVNKCQSLDPELFHSIINQAKPLGLSGIKLTGGEPLLHPRLHELLEVVRSERVQLSVETNGVLCTEDIAAAIKSACDSAFVSVSLDGATANTHEWIRGISGCFDAALNGIKYLVKVGIKPQIIMSLMRKNKEEINDLIKLAKSLGADSVKFNIVHPVAKGENLHNAMETLSIKELFDLGKEMEEFSALTELPVFYDHPPAFRPLKKILGNDGANCIVCNIQSILGVLPDGSYSLCGIGNKLPELVFGNARRDELEAVWKGNAMLNELRTGLPEKLTGICQRCLMKGLCSGSCIALNYYQNQNVWSPFWYCDEAYKAGLFPKNRMTQ